MNETIGRTPTPAESHEVEEQRPANSIAHTACLTLHTVVFIDKLPHNIIRFKAYGIPNAQNKTLVLYLFLLISCSL